MGFVGSLKGSHQRMTWKLGKAISRVLGGKVARRRQRKRTTGLSTIKSPRYKKTRRKRRA